MESWVAAIVVLIGVWVLCGCPPLGRWLNEALDQKIPDYVPEEWEDKYK